MSNTSPATRLAAQEAIIDRAQGQALAAAIDAGTALGVIRDQRLYVHQWRTFEDYCQERWEMRREQVDTLIRVAFAANAITDQGMPLPRSQRALLVLAPVADDPGRLTEVWSDALEESPTPTAKQVAAILRGPEPDQTHAFGVEEPADQTHAFGGYATELADPEGWRSIAERLLAEDRRRVEAGEERTYRIPERDPDGGWRSFADAFARLSVEGGACAAAWAQTLLDHRDEVTREATDEEERMVDEMWEVEDFVFQRWPVLQEFWAVADQEGWLDVRQYVTDRVAAIPEADTYRRAAAVVAVLDNDTD